MGFVRAPEPAVRSPTPTNCLLPQSVHQALPVGTDSFFFRVLAGLGCAQWLYPSATHQHATGLLHAYTCKPAGPRTQPDVARRSQIPPYLHTSASHAEEAYFMVPLALREATATLL